MKVFYLVLGISMIRGFNIRWFGFVGFNYCCISIFLFILYLWSNDWGGKRLSFVNFICGCLGVFKIVGCLL